MKKQLWLRPDECDLVSVCLQMMRTQLKPAYNSGNDAQKVVSNWVVDRIDELLPKFEADPE